MSITVDMSALAARKARAGRGVTYTDCLAQAIGQALAKHPAFNAHWTADGHEVIPDVRLALVVQTDRGLLLPVLSNVRSASLEQIASERERLVRQAHEGKLAASVGEATFTLSNVGAGHIDDFTALISPPQVAILSVGSVQKRPLVVDDVLTVRPVATLTLGADHRAIDGRQSAAFLEDLKIILEAGA
jgi:pyruvate dehydrogenase E2 component (dihydrolipoamide acetyltransferase)